MDQQVKLKRVANLLKALAHVSRMQIMMILAQQGRLNISAIQAQLPMQQSVLSQHLTKMKDSGILNRQRKGKEVYYSLSDPTLINIATLLLNRSGSKIW